MAVLEQQYLGKISIFPILIQAGGQCRKAIMSGRRKPWKQPRLSSYFLAQLSPFFRATTHLTLPRPFRLH